MKAADIPHGRYLAFLALLVALPALLHRWLPLNMALAGGFDVAALAFIASAAGHWRDGAPATIRDLALRDDGGRGLLLLVTTIILFAILIVVGGLIGRRAGLSPAALGAAVATLVIAWTFANLVYAFHYAKLFYDRGADGRDRRGLDFPGGSDPSFADFVNFSFVLGMTCQTADIAITSGAMRRTATVHGMLAFFFNLGVLAVTVNVLASAL